MIPLLYKQRQRLLLILMGRTTHKLPLLVVGSPPHLIMVLWIHMSHPINGIAIGSVVFAQLTNEPNTQTTLRAPFVAHTTRGGPFPWGILTPPNTRGFYVTFALTVRVEMTVYLLTYFLSWFLGTTRVSP